MSLSEKLREPKWVLVLLFGIIIGGTFLRTYQFHDFLRFNADQSRDATLVRDYVAGKEELPLLGPKAGGTSFRVGPAFYYFQIASAKIFGSHPDTVAYPDLFFALLTLPLLFFFLRKYFDSKTALLLVALFAVSLYAIKYSRFAWNPNSLPFWSMLFLYGLHEIMVERERTWKWWAVLTGGALGIGVQLHSLSLIIFPLMCLGVFGYLWKQKKHHVWKMMLVVVVVAVTLNIPQLVSEVKTGGENISAFFNSIGAKGERGNGLVQNAVKNVVCFSQSTAYILSAYDSSDTCEIKSVSKGLNMPVFVFGFFVFVGGCALCVRALRREVDESKKYFLGIIISYVALTFGILLPLANEISMRFFLIIPFMPLVFLGVWYTSAEEFFPRVSRIVFWCGVVVLLSLNLWAVEKSFTQYQSYLTYSSAGMDNVLLKEVEVASSYIISHAGDATKVAVSGDAQYLFKALKSMQYFTEQAGIQLVQKKKNSDPALQEFLIENTKQNQTIMEKRSDIADALTFGRFTIYSIESK